jgi:hypothetical protein
MRACSCWHASREQSGIAACCGGAGLPPLIADHLLTVHSLVTRARDATDEKLQTLVDADLALVDQLRHARTNIVSSGGVCARTHIAGIQGGRARTLAWLYSPHDFSYVHADEELMVSAVDVDGISNQEPDMTQPSSNKRAKTTMSIKSDGNTKRTAPSAKIITLITYDAEVAERRRVEYAHTLDAAQLCAATPHEQYQLGVLYAQRTKAFVKPAGTSVDEIEQQLLAAAKPKRYSHHDPSSGVGVRSTRDKQEPIMNVRVAPNTAAAINMDGYRLDGDEVLSTKKRKQLARELAARGDVQLNKATEAVRKRPVKQNQVQPFDYERFAAEQKGAA